MRTGRRCWPLENWCLKLSDRLTYIFTFSTGLTEHRFTFPNISRNTARLALSVETRWGHSVTVYGPVPPFEHIGLRWLNSSMTAWVPPPDFMPQLVFDGPSLNFREGKIPKYIFARVFDQVLAHLVMLHWTVS